MSKMSELNQLANEGVISNFGYRPRAQQSGSKPARPDAYRRMYKSWCHWLVEDAPMPVDYGLTDNEARKLEAEVMETIA